MNKQKNKRLAKLALAALLLAAHLPADAKITDESSIPILLAMAGCGQNSCAGTSTRNSPNLPPNLHANDAFSEPKRPAENNSQTIPTENNQTPNPQVADAGGDLSVKRTPTTVGGGYSTIDNSPYNNGYYGGSLDQYKNYSNQGYNIGGSYNIPQTRYGSSTEAGSWDQAARNDIGRSRVQAYNYSSYNTNRNFETSPSYQGHYLDKSFYSDSVAPYGARYTEGYDQSYDRSPGYGYEGIQTSGIMTEFQLKSIVSPEGWRTYQQLDPEGKALALQLASQANFPNKDLAIRNAYIRMQQRQSYMQKL